jgi:tyrosine decarboxylase/aspartate 1-decarboxylase
MMRTQFLTKELDALGIAYYNCPFMNIVTIKAEFIPENIAHKYGLVPQQHNENNKWYKIVLMDHVEVEHLTNFIDEMKASKNE